MSACKWLVSNFFQERSQTKVTIEIEHCVRLEDLFHSKKLQFISSVLESSHKCHFNLIEEEGNFSQKGSMGHCTMFLRKHKPSHLELLCKTMATRKKIECCLFNDIQSTPNPQYNYDMEKIQTYFHSSTNMTCWVSLAPFYSCPSEFL